MAKGSGKKNMDKERIDMRRWRENIQGGSQIDDCTDDIEMIPCLILRVGSLLWG